MTAKRCKAWIVDDDQSVRWVLEKALRQADYDTLSFDRAEHALDALKEQLKDHKPDVLLTDVRMPGMDGITLLERLADSHPELPVIVMTAHADLDHAVAAYRGGAFEYLPKPFDLDEVLRVVEKAVRPQREDGATAAVANSSQYGMPELIGEAPAMQQVFRSIGRLARSSMTVLITGESGTGKELVARALHQHSPRASQPFVALNTSAIAQELLESELFGHERGAFTGADGRRIGRFEQADGGTLFLDEIGDMSPALQTRLLRVLAESEFFRVGGQRTIRVDVRVIAATNQDLANAVSDGRFRADLYHRLNVIRIDTPPLRYRRQDIPALLEYYLSRSANELDAPAKMLNSEALEILSAYDWPGNVRQLVNTTRRLTINAPGSVITAVDLPADLAGTRPASAAKDGWTESLMEWAERYLDAPDADTLAGVATPLFERALIEVALKRAGGHRQKAAALLGWGRNTLTRKMQALDIG